MIDRRSENPKPRGSTLWVLGESIESADGSTRYAVKYEASPSDLVAELRRQVESGTIEGWMWDADDVWQREQYMSSGKYLVIPVSDGGSET